MRGGQGATCPEGATAHHRARRRGASLLAVAAAASALLAPAAAGAQGLGIEAGTGVVRLGRATTAGAMILAPALRLGDASSSLRLDGRFAGLMGGGLAAEVAVAGGWLHPVGDGLAVGARIDGRWSAFPDEADAGEVRARVSASVGSPAFGASGGIGVAGYRAPAGPRTALQGEATGWTRLGPVRLHASVAVSAFDERFTVGRDNVPAPPDSAPDSVPRVVSSIRSRRYADGEVGAEWRPGRLVVRVVWGARVGDAATAAESWGSVAAAYALRDGLALTGAAGVMPAAIERGLARAPFARIGLRFGLPASVDPVPIAAPTAAPSLVVRGAGDGDAVLRAHVPGARRVEVKGDFTDWQPVDLAAVGGGFWEARLRMTPGVHRVNMRVDGGAWIVPPGLPSLVDEFAGAVGIIVVE
jgi:hypothetical protein